MPKRFRKKPVVIEAHQWHKNGDHPQDHDPIGIEDPRPMTLEKYSEYKELEGNVVRRYRQPDHSGESICHQCCSFKHSHGWIDTLEGGHTVCLGDWIITGVKGERYPCKPDIFEETYDAVV